MNIDFEPTDTPSSDSFFLTPTEYAKSIRMSSSTVYRHLAEKRLPAIQPGGKHGGWRIHKDATVPDTPPKSTTLRSVDGTATSETDFDKPNNSRPSGARPNWMRR